MIVSMTGFGKAAQKSPYGKVIAEIKTLNHKSLSVACSPFNGFFLLEEKVKKLIEEKIHRGKVFVRLRVEATGTSKPLRHIEINTAVAGEFVKKIKAVKKSLGISGEIGVAELITFPGVVEMPSETGEEKIWPYMEKALNKALESLIRFRRAEGRRIAVDFRKRLSRIKELNTDISKYSKESEQKFREKLAGLIAEAKNGAEADNGRLETEVALFARNSDVTEEMVRLKGHIASYAETLKEKQEEAGKKLDFIAQEMQREANTIGSKSAELRVSRAVIEVKSEIEKMREQIKNIE